jgi:Matrixin
VQEPIEPQLLGSAFPRAISRRGFLAACGVLASTLTRRVRAAPSRTPVPLSFAVALEGDVAVRDSAWIDEQIAAMAELYAPLDLHPVKVGVRTMPSTFLHMETRADRDALASELRPGVANVFIVGTLRDVDEPSKMRRGVHWRNRKDPSHRYVIVAAEAMPTVLAHEMGHYFGLGHSSVQDNLMSYDRTGGRVFLDDAQARIIKASASEAFRSHELALPENP